MRVWRSRVLALAIVQAVSPSSLTAQDTLQLPRTVAEAVNVLRTKWLKPADRDWILRTPQDVAVTQMHLPFGTAARNAFHLWRDNDALRRSCKSQHPEGCSSEIFAQLWLAIRADADTLLVRRLDCQFALAEKLRVRYRGFARRTLGGVLSQLQQQIDSQLVAMRDSVPPGCEAQLTLRRLGNPDLRCWVRAEFSEDGNDPVSLESFFGWFDWRNGFTVAHSPPAIDLRFSKRCTWPKRPTWFTPG